MRKMLFLALGIIAFSILSILLAEQYLNAVREKAFIFPISEVDKNGENADAWREIRSNINVHYYWGVNYQVNFFTTKASLDEVIVFFDNSLGGKIVERDYYPEKEATWIFWRNFRDSMVLTYSPTAKEGVYSLVIERLWSMSGLKYVFGI
jgi:hypothetical protein